MRPRRLSVAGAGAAGTALALALARVGWTLDEIACRTAERAAARCAILGGGTPLTLEALADPRRGLDPEPRLLLVAVPDGALPATAAALAARAWPDGSVALHLSGAVEVAALAPLAAAGLAIGSLHPLKSFVDPERDAATLGGTVLALEGDPAALELAEALAGQLGARPFRLAPGSRPAWHAAASHAANHLVALLDQALDLMAIAGLDRETARAALLPLMAGTLDNLSTHAPEQALTGPIVRGDVAAVERHLAALAEAPIDVAAAYHALARRAVELARRRGLDDRIVRQLLAALGDARSP